jgi:hypothetical protein
MNSFGYNGPNYPVPAGKVWKVEKFSMTGGIGGVYLSVNNTHNISQADVNLGPLWLKSGDNIKATTSCYSCGGLSGSYFISILEFNIVP